MSKVETPCKHCGSFETEWLTCLGCHGHEDRKDYQICQGCGADA